MPHQKSEKGIWRFLGLKRVLVANAVIFAIVLWGITGEFLRNRDMQREVDRLAAQTSAMEKQNAEVEDMGKRFSSGAMLEREARTKLNLQKPGEQVVVVRTTGMEERADIARTKIMDGAEAQLRPMSNVARWWRYFFQ